MGFFDKIGEFIKDVVVAIKEAIESLFNAEEDTEKCFDKNKKVDEPRETCGKPDPSPPKKKEEPKIVSVAFLHGDDKTELGRTGKHFVNLPRDAKWADGTHVANIDRLSQKPRVKARFNVKGKHKFKVKYEYTPHADPGVAVDKRGYTTAEKGRNNNFKHQDKEKSYTTDADGTKIITDDFFVNAAGKDEYKLIAKDESDTEVRSQKIVGHRLVFYKEIKMKTVSAAANLTTVETEYAKHNIKLVSLGSVEMDHMPNISTGDSATFKTKARTAYSGSNAKAKEPYVVAIGYTDHLAVKDASQVVVKSGVAVGPGKPDVVIPIVDGSGNSKFLWNNIVPGEKWFVSAKFLKNGGTAGTDDVTITEANCTGVADAAYGADYLNKVKVTVTGLAAATGTITLTVNWVNRMRGGLSFGGGNLVCVCTKAWWRTESSASQNQVVVHEMGHKIGMVADGTGTGPDKTAKHYSGKGHIGNHCHQGLAVKASYATDTGTCVMFGATHAKTAFCDDCKPAVRKQDLSAGWTAF